MTAPAAVRERPILFSGPMVRAILDGSKTQTRRVVIPQPSAEVTDVIRNGHEFVAAYPNRSAIRPYVYAARPRYGLPGDRLWVRETWRAWATVGAGTEVRTEYQADGRVVDRHLDDWTVPRAVAAGGWGPSIFMPRWACRLVLELTDVRVELVQSIGEEDIGAEGVEPCLDCDNLSSYHDEDRPHWWREDYAALWDSLNAKRGYGWDANPWVWVLSFRRVEP